MPIGFYIVPYKRRLFQTNPFPLRYCAIDDYTSQIYGAGGRWAETEILGNRAIVKVRTTTKILADLDLVFKRMPKTDLKASLSTITTTEESKLNLELLDQGYSQLEITDKLGSSIKTKTQEDVFKVMTTRRFKPRYDTKEDQIILDGPLQQCRSINSVDKEVSEIQITPIK